MNTLTPSSPGYKEALEMPMPKHVLTMAGHWGWWNYGRFWRSFEEASAGKEAEQEEALEMCKDSGQMPAAQGGELLPCPLCGSNDIYDAINYDSYTVEIECQGCGAIIDAPLSQSDENSYEESVEIIAGLKARWNRRPAPMTPQGASEARDLLSGEWPGGFTISADQTLVEMVDSIREGVRKLVQERDAQAKLKWEAYDANKALTERLEAPHPQQERAEEWECFCDESYYDMWAVRPKGDRSFQSQQLFHLPSKEEAEALRDILSRRADERGQP